MDARVRAFQRNKGKWFSPNSRANTNLKLTTFRLFVSLYIHDISVEQSTIGHPSTDAT